MERKYTLVLGDARSMRRVLRHSVHLVVTSPPYWQLKDYETGAQIGFHQTYKEYLQELRKVWKECARVLRPGCRAAVNIGDQFCRASTYGRYRVIPIHADIIRQFESLELDFMGSIIWQKVTTCNTSGGGVVMGSFPHPRNGIVKLDYEHILIFKKPGEAPRVAPKVKAEAKLTTEEWNELFYGHWNFPGTRQKGHIATFPEELPRRLIRMFTFPGETVLDPFLGSGTTLKVARALRRSCIGYEVQPKFEAVIRETSGFGRQKELFQDGELQVIREPEIAAGSGNGTAGERDAGRLGSPGGYGSVVRKGDSRYRERYYRVERVVGPLQVKLDDGRKLELVGLRENGRSTPEGCSYLESLVRGERVYLRNEPLSAERNRVYLYLKNRTCINSRLVRAGLADVDREQDFRLKRRYLKYEAEREGSP